MIIVLVLLLSGTLQAQDPGQPTQLPPAQTQVPPQAGQPPPQVAPPPVQQAFPEATPPQDQTLVPAEVVPLAPGPATTEQPAPVNPGNYNVPAPATPPTEAPITSVVETVDPKALPQKEVKKKVLATFRTSMGNFVVKLFTRQAPRTTKHFMELARGEKEFIDAKTGQKVRRPFYNGLIFHRVMKNFIIQGGCPFGNGTGGPGYTIADEFTPSLRHKKAGIVSMANAGARDTNGSQFFITLGPQPDFDDKYTIFGEVVQGMDVVKDISRIRVGPTDRPVKRITLIGIDFAEEVVP